MMTPMTPGLANRSQSMILIYTETIIGHNQWTIQMHSLHWRLEQGKNCKNTLNSKHVVMYLCDNSN